MKRGGFLKRRTPLAAKGGSDTAHIKDDIQATVRAIVIARDGGCIFQLFKRGEPDLAVYLNVGDGVPSCNGYAKDGHLILQADHLVTRANSATYADTRLVVCVCKGHHGWKKWNEQRYNEIVRQLLPADRVALWDKAHAARYIPTRMTSSDWAKELAALKQELRKMHIIYPPQADVVL
jgi:hypothetical protein